MIMGLVVVLVAAMLVGIVGCGGDSKEPAPAETNGQEAVEKISIMGHPTMRGNLSTRDSFVCRFGGGRTDGNVK